MASSSTTTTQPSLPPTHRALVQEVYAETPTVKTIPTPQPTPGSAVLAVLSAGVVSYIREIYNGTRRYPYPTPLTLGNSAICRVAAPGPDSTSLDPGTLCFYDCTIRSRTDPSHIFLSAIYDGDSPGSKKLMRDVWRDGTYAEYVSAPLENIFPLNENRLLSPVSEGGLGYTIDDLPSLPRLLVPYGGLRDVHLSPGETVIIAPATGSFGGAAVKVALAMGAGKILAVGRNVAQLDTVVAEGHGRVVAIPLTDTTDQDSLQATFQSHGPVDVFFDISPPHASASAHFRPSILSLRHGGRVSLMGGQLTDLPLPIRKVMHENITIRGTWMYTPTQVKELVKMVESGVLKLRDGEGMTCKGVYGLEGWEGAFDAAAEVGGKGFVVLKPGMK